MPAYGPALARGADELRSGRISVIFRNAGDPLQEAH
jgi:hypothetical protein